MRLLDLFCGAGGCTKGYQRVGFEVWGVDLHPQPHYCGERFQQMDALEYLARYGTDNFDAIHASPPCQSYSKRLRHMAAPKPALLDPTRVLLERSGLPWVMENVIGAPLQSQDTLDGRYGLELCGTQLGLRVGWHRLFESSIPLLAPEIPCRCDSILRAESP